MDVELVLTCQSYADFNWVQILNVSHIIFYFNVKCSMLSWTYALKQEDSSLFTPHFPGKRQCYPGIDSQKDYKQGLHGVYDENEEEGHRLPECHRV